MYVQSYIESKFWRHSSNIDEELCDDISCSDYNLKHNSCSYFVEWRWRCLPGASERRTPASPRRAGENVYHTKRGERSAGKGQL